jgi:large subunit ribosomal protein L35
MPRFKGKSGAKKRFKLTASGQLKREKAYRSHILTKKTSKRRRKLRKATLVDTTQLATIKKLILA